jgi:hypothetical protein
LYHIVNSCDVVSSLDAINRFAHGWASKWPAVVAVSPLRFCKKEIKDPVTRRACVVSYPVVSLNSSNTSVTIGIIIIM